MSDTEVAIMVGLGVALCAVYVWYIRASTPKFNLYIDGKEYKDEKQ